MQPSSLAVLGLGAIGGSVAWQARRAGVARVVGYDPNLSHQGDALKAGALDDVATTPERAVAGAELVVLAGPPGIILQQLATIGRHLAPGALVTDVASLKSPMLAAAVTAGLGARFAGSHPYAGTHVAGWAGARPDRFSGALTYVCATGPDGDAAAREVMDFWATVMGAQPVLIDAAAHDRQLAWTSHLPQAVASALAHALAGAPGLSGATYGTGARDTTRLAASPAELWAEVFLMNQGPVLEALAVLAGDVATLRELIAQGDRARLARYLGDAAAFRQGLERGAPLVPPDGSR